MGKNLRTALLTFFTGGLIVSFQNCGSDSKKSSSSSAGSLATAHAPTESELKGIWDGSCINQGNFSFKMNIEIYDPKTIDIVVYMYASDTTCSQVTQVDAHRGTFEILPSQVPQAAKLSANIVGFARLPATALVAQTMNNQMTCGSNTWATGVAQSFSPSTPNCMQLPAKFEPDIGVSGNIMYFVNSAGTALEAENSMRKR